MVVHLGQWTEEQDYNTYPKEKWCDYDRMAVWIRSKGYEPKTSMKNLIDRIFDLYECDLEYSNEEFSIEGCQAFVETWGISEFDYDV